MEIKKLRCFIFGHRFSDIYFELEAKPYEILFIGKCKVCKGTVTSTKLLKLDRGKATYETKD